MTFPSASNVSGWQPFPKKRDSDVNNIQNYAIKMNRQSLSDPLAGAAL